MAEKLRDRLNRWDAGAQAFWTKVWRFTRPIVYLYVLVCAIVGAYEELDRRGLIRHSAVVQVSVSGDWFTGEYKECYATVKRTGDQGPLSCGESVDAKVRMMPIVFWGKVRYEERAKEYEKSKDLGGTPAVTWSCQRMSDSLTCRAK